MTYDQQKLLVSALDQGGELEAAPVRASAASHIAMKNLRADGLFTYHAEEGKPAVFRLTEAGRRLAAIEA